MAPTFDDDPLVEADIAVDETDVLASGDPNLPKVTAVAVRKPEVRTLDRPRASRKISREELLYREDLNRKRQAYVANSKLVRATSADTDTTVKLAMIQTAIAQEVAVLQFNREQQDLAGQPSTSTSGKIVSGLKDVADLEFKMRALGHQTVDLNHPKIQRMLNLWIETIQEVATATLPPEQCDVFITRLTTAMDGWEQRVESENR